MAFKARVGTWLISRAFYGTVVLSASLVWIEKRAGTRKSHKLLVEGGHFITKGYSPPREKAVLKADGSVEVVPDT